MPTVEPGAPMLPTLYDSAQREIRLLHPLGRGGFGAVFLADVRAGDGLVQRLAVKVLDEKYIEDRGIAARARDEARLMSQLNHDHVVKVHGLTEIGRRAAVLMEYVEGIDCSALLQVSQQFGEGGLPVSVACQVTERTAAALDAAWNTRSPQTNAPLHVVHRDIKPANILLSVGGMVKVMDFGVARADFEREAKSSVMMFGTERYMAAERFIDGRCGPESDIYSLGVTFWELLTGRRFDRLALKRENYQIQLQAHLDILEKLPDVAPHRADLSAVLSGMLSFDPDKRLSARQVEDRLQLLSEQIKGIQIRKYSQALVPGQLAIRRKKLLEDPELKLMVEALAREVATSRAALGLPAAPPPRVAEPDERLRAKPMRLEPAMTRDVRFDLSEDTPAPVPHDAPPTTFEPRPIPVLPPRSPPPKPAARPKLEAAPAGLAPQPRERIQVPPVVLPDVPLSEQLQRVRERRGEPLFGLATAGFAAVILVAAIARIIWLVLHPLPDPATPEPAPSVIEATP